MHQAGLRIPQDVSLFGFDDAPSAKWLEPGLSTVYHAAPLRPPAPYHRYRKTARWSGLSRPAVPGTARSSLFGFDDAPSAKWLEPGLSTVYLPIDNMITTAIDPCGIRSPAWCSAFEAPSAISSLQENSALKRAFSCAKREMAGAGAVDGLSAHRQHDHHGYRSGDQAC
jgi:hypothetical protein